MPPAATAIAQKVNSLYGFMLVTSLIFFVLLIGGMIYFVYKYKRKGADDKTPYITHDHTLEFVWSFIPFVIFMVCFAWGAYVYMEMRTFDANAMEINVTGKKWVWEFDYKNGKKVMPSVDESGKIVPSTLVVPINMPVKLVMTSEKVTPSDKAVLHAFYVPAFRVKQDVVPGRYSALTFTATEKGLFQVFCAEFCGTGHSQMMAKIKVVDQQEFDDYILGESSGGGTGGNPVFENGMKVYQKYACIGCHTLDGTPSTGPTWKGLYGSKRMWNDGGSATADENYIRDSILEPNKHIAKGFEAGKMPMFKGMITDEEITQIIDFMKLKK
jgi:cytochrome c oxidase subunit 2